MYSAITALYSAFESLEECGSRTSLFRNLSLHAFQGNGTHPNRPYTDSITTCLTKKECDTVVSKIPAACFWQADFRYRTRQHYLYTVQYQVHILWHNVSHRQQCCITRTSLKQKKTRSCSVHCLLLPYPHRTEPGIHVKSRQITPGTLRH